jgi:hypothetical protein
MKTIFTSVLLTLFSLPLLVGQNSVTVDGGAPFIAFMSVFNLDGTVNFGSFWAIPDLKAVPNAAANTLTLQPNFSAYANAAPDDEFWINQTTGEGNKDMEGSIFVEPGAGFNGTELTFSGTVQSYTLDEGYTAKYFIKALDPNADFSDALGGSLVFDLPTSGNFSVTAAADELAPGLVIQYGFTIFGRNANPANEADLGNIVVGPGAVSVRDINNLQTKIDIYPNPAVDVLSINSETPVLGYQVSTLLGQTLLSGGATNNVDVSRLAAGTYLVTVQVEEGKKVIKFLKS